MSNFFHSNPNYPKEERKSDEEDSFELVTGRINQRRLLGSGSLTSREQREVT